MKNEKHNEKQKKRKENNNLEMRRTFSHFLYKTGEILKFSRCFSRPILVARFWPTLGFFLQNPLRFPVLEPFILCLFSLF